MQRGDLLKICPSSWIVTAAGIPKESFGIILGTSSANTFKVKQYLVYHDTKQCWYLPDELEVLQKNAL